MSEAFTSLDGWLLRTSLAGGIVLLVGTVWMLLTRQPVQRQRIGESALLAALLVALPASMPQWWSIPGTAANSPTNKVLFGSDPAMNEPRVALTKDTELKTEYSSHELELFELAGILKSLEIEHDEFDPALIQNDKVECEQCTKGSAAPFSLNWLMWTLRIVGLAYLGMVSVLLIRCSIGYYGLWQYWRQRRPAPAHVHLALAELEPEESRRPRIGVNSMVHGPVSYGLWKQTILLPPHFCNEGDPEKLRWILAHELTHLRRRDAWGCLLLAIGGAFYFHVPWFWWMKRHVRLAQEFLADAAAVQIANAVDYAQYLVSLTTLTSRPTLASSHAASVFESPSDLYRRVHMLLHQRSILERGAPRWWTLTAAASFLALATCTAGLKLHADEPQGKAEVQLIVVDDDAKKDGDKDKKKALTLRDGKFAVQGDGKTFSVITDDKDNKHGMVHLQNLLSDDKQKKLDEAMKKLEQVLEKLPRQVDGDTRAKLEELKKTLKSLNDNKNVLTLRAAQLAKDAEGTARIRLFDTVKDGEEQKKKALTHLLAAQKQAEAHKEHALAAEKLARVAQEKALLRWREAKDGDQKDQAIKELEKAIAEKERALKSLKSGQANVTRVSPLFRVKTDDAASRPAAGSSKGRLGVVVGDIDSNLREHLDLSSGQGLMIQEVIDPSPAWNNGNGLRSSDILLELGGKKVPANQDQFREMVSKLGEGNTNAVVLRKGKKLTIGGIKLPAVEKVSKVVWQPGEVKVDVAPLVEAKLNDIVVDRAFAKLAVPDVVNLADVKVSPRIVPADLAFVPHATTVFSNQQQGSKPRLGVTLEEVPEAVSTQLELGDDRGLLVKEVIDGSAAKKAGILKNDILIEFADKPVSRNHEAFTLFVKGLKPGKYTATVVRKGKEIRIRDITIADAKAVDEERKAKAKEWLVEGDEKMKDELKEVAKNKANKEANKKQKDDFFPNANRGINQVRNTGNMSVSINNDQFTATKSDEGKTITMTGKMVSGKAQPSSITIKTDDGEKKYKTVKDVPEEDREAVEKMLSSFKGNAFMWNGAGNFNNAQFNKQLEDQMRVFERSMKQLGDGNPGFEQMEKELQRLREQLKKVRGIKEKDNDDEN